MLISKREILKLLPSEDFLDNFVDECDNGRGINMECLYECIYDYMDSEVQNGVKLEGGLKGGGNDEMS